MWKLKQKQYMIGIYNSAKNYENPKVAIQLHGVILTRYEINSDKAIYNKAFWSRLDQQI